MTPLYWSGNLAARPVSSPAGELCNSPADDSSPVGEPTVEGRGVPTGSNNKEIVGYFNKNWSGHLAARPISSPAGELCSLPTVL